MRAAENIFKAVYKAELNISVIGIPKTTDNIYPMMDN